MQTSRLDWVKRLFCVCAMFLLLGSASAAPKLSADSPLGFFTNAASAMFQQSNFRDANNNLITVTNIPIYPLNYYTPAVHRLLQVAANIYEGTTTNLYQCIYRPYFTAQGTNIYISGYELVNGPDNLPTDAPTFLTIPRDLNNPADRATIGATPTPQNFYGVPWVIGAKKGFPNLNQISMQSVSTITRKLQVTRPLTRNTWNGYYAKQEYIIGVSNSMAVEFWNSYSNDYPRSLFVQADGYVMASLNNDLGYAPAPLRFNMLGNATLPANGLKGSGLRLTVAAEQPSPQSFVLPLLTNVIVQPDAYYDAGVMYPVAINNGTTLWNSLPQNNLYQPQWKLRLTNNLRCIVMDGGSGGRVVDYVQLNLTPPSRDLTVEMLQHDARHVWSTNATSTYWQWSGPGGGTGLPQGIAGQLSISLGSPALSDAEWSNIGLPVNNKAFLIAYFAGFMQNSTVSSNTTQAPLIPIDKIYSTFKWQANDPLVHYLADDLGMTNIPPILVLPPNAQFPLITSNLLFLNDRYSPWGGNGPRTGWNPYSGVDPHLFDTALKDPLVRSSDSWNFPSNQPLNFSWIGQVHRGTPWQTIYLKSANILSTDLPAWAMWNGSRTLLAATNIAPVNDWRLASLLISLLNTNDQQLSVNNFNTNAWLGIMDGLLVETNDAAQLQLGTTSISSNSPQAAVIVNAIGQTRTNANVWAGPVFKNYLFNSPGDVLATPELTDHSPFLDINHLQAIQAGGITDEAVEKIPSQLLPLLRLDSIGSASFANGQLTVQFTGDDNYTYAVETSSNLVDWVAVGTNSPMNGVFIFNDIAPSNSGQRFYRSVLLP